MNILGLIPARGGSKGIPHKNVAQIAGRPLLAWTAEAALNSKRLTRVVLSTDDEEIAEVGLSLGLEVPFLRPEELARDDSPVIVAIKQALFMLEPSGYWPDAVMLLQPTSPLRRASHIDEAAEILETTGADTVVSLVAVPHQFNPLSVMTITDGRVAPWSSGEMITRRQDKPVVYARNGPAILLTQTHVINEQNRLYGDDCRPLLMSANESLDIDNPEDLEMFNLIAGAASGAKESGHRNWIDGANRTAAADKPIAFHSSPRNRRRF